MPTSATKAPQIRVTIALLPSADAAALEATLHALALGDYPDFKVLAVAGPVWDDTRLAAYRDGVRRLAASDDASPRRRLLDEAMGELVTFLEPGTCPQPPWLRSGVAAFRASDEVAVGGAAGALGARDGFLIATRDGEFSRADRPCVTAYPCVARITLPDPAGTIFHRQRLLDAGGFDSGLENTRAVADAAFRLVDRGYITQALDSPGVVSANRVAAAPGLVATAAPPRRLHLVFFCQWHVEPPNNGIERIISQLARGLAERGHTVRLMTRGGEQRRIAFEHGIWVHWVPATPHPLPPEISAPSHFWNYSASLQDELAAVHRRHPVDAVQSPNWDSEGIASIASAEVPTVLGVYTPFKTWLPLNLGKLKNIPDLDAVVTPIMAAEQFCYAHAGRLLACGHAIIEEIEHQYGMSVAPERIAYIAHGMADMSSQVKRRRPDDDGEVRILFVGRLERRKGIDTVFECIAPVCRRHPNARFVIVGDDKLEEEPGLLHRRAFEHSAAGREFADRVRFTGMVDEAELWQHYADCDIFVAPSRFESFGLILVEAMMFGRTVIGGRIPGMSEIITQDVDGFLTPPGDAAALEPLLDRLIASPALRREIGRRGRLTYEAKFALRHMIDNAERFYLGLAEASLSR